MTRLLGRTGARAVERLDRDAQHIRKVRSEMTTKPTDRPVTMAEVDARLRAVLEAMDAEPPSAGPGGYAFVERALAALAPATPAPLGEPVEPPDADRGYCGAFGAGADVKRLYRPHFVKAEDYDAMRDYARAEHDARVRAERARDDTFDKYVTAVDDRHDFCRRAEAAEARVAELEKTERAILDLSHPTLRGEVAAAEARGRDRGLAEAANTLRKHCRDCRGCCDKCEQAAVAVEHAAKRLAALRTTLDAGKGES